MTVKPTIYKDRYISINASFGRRRKVTELLAEIAASGGDVRVSSVKRTGLFSCEYSNVEVRGEKELLNSTRLKLVEIFA